MMRQMRTIHKYFGLVTVIVVILVSITGVLLIHKKAIGLNRVAVKTPGYAAPQAVDGFDMLETVEGLTVVATKQGVYVREASGWTLTLPSPTKKLYRHGGTLYACSRDGLYSSKEGKSWIRLFSGQEVKAVHFAENDLLFATSTGIYRGNYNGEELWKEIVSFFDKPVEVRNFTFDEKGVTLVAKEGVFTSVTGKELLSEQLPFKKKGSEKVDLQKLITDIHTGEFFGSFFYIFMDITAIGLVAMSVTGVYIWYRPRSKKKGAKGGT